jgi:exodeoxyribonuclease-1
MFVFYDIETTGINIAYDQILQFGAILADDNLIEIDRFEIRCRLLPWVVPAPKALLVTQTPVSRLTDPWLPNFFEMMRTIAERLVSWGPATFIGYNSMRFDEPFMQRAFWQTLLPPYLTVTGGNARLDLLPLIRAAAYFRPGLLNTPLREDGGTSFRLDGLASANGFNEHRAHDAMGDVEATLFLARFIATRLPALWRPLASRASKASSTAILALEKPIFLISNGSALSAAFYQRIDTGEAPSSHAVLARLGYDWRLAKTKIDDFKSGEIGELRKALRRTALNKAPLVFTLAEAEGLSASSPSAFELEQARFLAAEPDFCLRLTGEAAPVTREEGPGGKELEEEIFEGFPSLKDERLMVRFHHSAPPEQVTITRAFTDLRFRRLAMRLLYLSAPQLLAPREAEQMRLGIERRLTAARDNPHPWRSIPDALAELTVHSQEASALECAQIAVWLRQKLENVR